MRVLLTGGTGFVGSHILFELLIDSFKFEVFVTDNLSNSKRECLEEIEKYTKKKLDFQKST